MPWRHKAETGGSVSASFGSGKSGGLWLLTGSYLGLHTCAAPDPAPRHPH